MFISAFCESMLYRAVVEKVNYRAGRYLFFMLLFSSGMWIAATCETYCPLSQPDHLPCPCTAFLPSSFAMYANMLAFTYAIEPPSSTNIKRTLYSTMAFATGALVGWPFAAAIAIPFAVEELFVHGTDAVTGSNGVAWLARRWARFATCAAIAALLAVRLML